MNPESLIPQIFATPVRQPGDAAQRDDQLVVVQLLDHVRPGNVVGDGLGVGVHRLDNIMRNIQVRTPVLVLLNWLIQLFA